MAEALAWGKAHLCAGAGGVEIAYANQRVAMTLVALHYPLVYFDAVGGVVGCRYSVVLSHVQAAPLGEYPVHVLLACLGQRQRSA